MKNDTIKYQFKERIKENGYLYASIIGEGEVSFLEEEEKKQGLKGGGTVKGNFIGNLLRMERIRQGKGQKEICYGICVTSYLCKIEKGQVSPDEQIVKKLLANLDIDYCEDEKLLQQGKKLVEEYYEQMDYGLPRVSFKALKELEGALLYSELGLDYRIICGFEGEEVYEEVKSCEGCMTEQQLGRFYLMAPMDKGWEEVLKRYEKAYKVLGSSYSLLKVFVPLYQLGQYTEIQKRAKICRELAIEEGNTFVLAHTFFAQGDAYATLNLEELMLEYYERGLRLLQNTYWAKDNDFVYYNIGATFVTVKNYEKAREYLDKIQEKSFLVYHKKALISIRTGNLEEGKVHLDWMKAYLDSNEECLKAYELMYEEACMEQKEDYLKDPAYLELMEKLKKTLEEELHFGFIYFYKEQIVEAYCSQKKYKRALAFQKEISSKTLTM